MYSIGSETWSGVSKLIEEMGELQQVLGKLIGSNGNTNHWSGNLNEKLIEELGDVEAALTFFINVNNLNQSAIADRSFQKETQYWKWHNG